MAHLEYFVEVDSHGRSFVTRSMLVVLEIRVAWRNTHISQHDSGHVHCHGSIHISSSLLQVVRMWPRREPRTSHLLSRRARQRHSSKDVAIAMKVHVDGEGTHAPVVSRAGVGGTGDSAAWPTDGRFTERRAAVGDRPNAGGGPPVSSGGLHAAGSGNIAPSYLGKQ